MKLHASGSQSVSRHVRTDEGTTVHVGVKMGWQRGALCTGGV